MASRSSAPPLDESEMAAWHALIHAHAKIVRQLEAELEAEQGLTLPAYEVLAHLSEAPDRRLRMSELASFAVLTPSGLTRLVDKLARGGLGGGLCRARAARGGYAGITPAGLARAKAGHPPPLRRVRSPLRRPPRPG